MKNQYFKELKTILKPYVWKIGKIKEQIKACMWRKIKRLFRRKDMANNGEVAIPLLVI